MNAPPPHLSDLLVERKCRKSQKKKKKNRMRRSTPTNPPTRESRHGLKWLIGQEGQLRGIKGSDAKLGSGARVY